MGIGPIVSLASGLISSLLTEGAGKSSSSAPADSKQPSPFAQILGSLQQLQQSNPTQYSQVTLQISNNLQSASHSATQLSSDFRNASTSGRLPNVQDLAQAVGGAGGGHHHRGGPADTDSLNPQSIILNTLSNAGVSII